MLIIGKNFCLIIKEIIKSFKKTKLIGGTKNENIKNK
jgi:hypothetical protein